jgi:hypothetical protein
VSRVLDNAARVLRCLTILAVASLPRSRSPGSRGCGDAACAVHYSVHAGEQGILDHAQKQDSACPWKLPGSRTANTRKLGPSKLRSEPRAVEPHDGWWLF